MINCVTRNTLADTLKDVVPGHILVFIKQYAFPYKEAYNRSKSI